MAEISGGEKFLAAAREIAKTVGKDDVAAEDIVQILSSYDGKSPERNKGRPSVRATLDRSLNSLEKQILEFVAADGPIWSNPADSSAFLDAVDELITCIGDWKSMAGDKSVAVCVSRADDLIQKALFRLQDEFRFLMNGTSDPFDSDDDLSDEEEEDEGGNHGFQGDQTIVARPVTDYNILIESLSPIIINDLHEIANRMVAGGFGKECSHVYSCCRRAFLEESMRRLMLQNQSIQEVQETPWQDIEDEIERWTKAIVFAFRVLFPSERLLCDRIFSGISAVMADLSFMEVCRGTTTQLLNFADAIAIGSRSPERLFKVIDVYEVIGDLMPTIESLFADQHCSVMGNEAISIEKRLGDAIRGIFKELENLIRSDPAKTAFPGGGIHPINRYVMNYLRAACKSHQILEQVFEEVKINSRNVSKGIRTLSMQMGWVLELLESNLEAKSRIYTDVSLSFVFMMNNLRYILEKTKNSELGLIVGDDWIAKNTAKLRQYRSNYRRSSWSQVVGLLKFENINNPNSQVMKSMKENLRLFNSRFDEICQTQSGWVVPDQELRDELRISVMRLVLPAYKNFVRRFREMHVEKYITYRIEDMEARIKELFRGNSS